MAEDSYGIMSYKFIGEWPVMGMCVLLLKCGTGGSHCLLEPMGRIIPLLFLF